MSTELIIHLKGEIQDSNFTEWRTGLIAQIKAADKVLTTDQDFIEADGLIKGFKVAEASLVQAKKEALAQAADITKLFDAIDEVSLQCRSTRLNLERQYRQRKEEIKNDLLQAAAKQIQECISDQDEDYRRVAPVIYDPMDLQECIKGKRNIDSMELALDAYTYKIQEEIAATALEIHGNRRYLNSLPEDLRHLCPDGKNLLAMPLSTLEATISSRIHAFEAAEAKRKQKEAEEEAESERRKADQSVEDARQIARKAIKAKRDRLFREADAELVRQEEEAKTSPVTVPETTPPPEDKPEPVENYVIRVYFKASHSDAEEWRRAVHKWIMNNDAPWVSEYNSLTLDTV